MHRLASVTRNPQFDVLPYVWIFIFIYPSNFSHYVNMPPLWHVLTVQVNKIHRGIRKVFYLCYVFFNQMSVKLCQDSCSKVDALKICGTILRCRRKVNVKHASRTDCIFMLFDKLLLLFRYFLNMAIRLHTSAIIHPSSAAMCKKGQHTEIAIRGSLEEDSVLDPFRYSWDIDILSSNGLILALFLTLCTWCAVLIWESFC